MGELYEMTGYALDTATIFLVRDKIRGFYLGISLETLTFLP